VGRWGCVEKPKNVPVLGNSKPRSKMAGCVTKNLATRGGLINFVRGEREKTIMFG